MSEPVQSPETWMPLSTLERRVLGVLLEKAKTTPDAYPLSLNALTTGSNQKSNREPIMNVTEDEVDDTLVDLQKKGLITRITGGRVERFRHNMYDVWKVNKVELAVLAELFLRGPQTEGELRSHASRMEPIESLDELREVLQPLRQRGLVFWIGMEGRRGSQICHGFVAPYERERLIKAGPREVEPLPSSPSAIPPSPAVSNENPEEMKLIREELTTCKRRIDELEAMCRDLASRIQQLTTALGG